MYTLHFIPTWIRCLRPWLQLAVFYHPILPPLLACTHVVASDLSSLCLCPFFIFCCSLSAYWISLSYVGVTKEPTGGEEQDLASAGALPGESDMVRQVPDSTTVDRGSGGPTRQVVLPSRGGAHCVPPPPPVALPIDPSSLHDRSCSCRLSECSTDCSMHRNRHAPPEP